MFRFQRNAWFDIHLGDDFVVLLVFSTMLGSTVATYSASVYGVAFGRIWFFFVTVNLVPEVDSPGLVRTWKPEHYFNKQLL